MAKYTFLDLAEDVLRQSGKPMTAEQVWKEAERLGYANKLATSGKTPWMTIASRLYVDTKDNPASKFVRVGKWPALFGLKGVHECADVESGFLENDADDDVLSGQGSKYKERDLHPLLAYFAHTYMDRIYVRTIFHEKSQKNKFSEWVHPDLVGVSFAFPELLPDVDRLADAIGAKPLRLWSFELKLKLGFSNLREAFFQAVSNSSWAHRGYLVAAEIDGSAEFKAELGRLSESFRIGVIRLDLNVPDDSEIVFEAHGREDLDWATVNKLAELNPDFRQFIKDVQIDVRSKKIHPSEYDPIPKDADDIKKILEAKQKK
ncbi:MAG: HTH domain-containing protein [Tepidimonas sp.]|nr:HTH domain-containing protein [Tepidimonas sp.]